MAINTHNNFSSFFSYTQSKFVKLPLCGKVGYPIHAERTKFLTEPKSWAASPTAMRIED